MLAVMHCSREGPEVLADVDAVSIHTPTYPVDACTSKCTFLFIGLLSLRSGEGPEVLIDVVPAADFDKAPSLK